MSAHSDDFADGRFVWKQALFDHFSDDENVACEIDIFVAQVATVAERKGIGGEKASIRADDGETRRRLDAVINRLAFEITTKALETNLLRLSAHELVVAQSLPIGDIAPVLIFFLRLATRVDVHRVFRELKNI